MAVEDGIISRRTLQRGRGIVMAPALAAILALGLPAHLAFADAGAPAAAAPANGSYLRSRLLPTEPQATCPPNIGPIYRASAIVTGTDMRQRPWGFARTLRAVLVKVSGDPRLKDEPRARQLTEHADQMVACFRYADLMADVPLHDDQGTYDRPHELIVYFDPAKIDAALAQLGEHPWRGERPVVVPILLVHGRKPPSSVLSSDDPAARDQQAAFANAAREFGMKLRIPSATELRAWGADAKHAPATPPTAGAGEAVVVGTLDWSETLPGWIGKWRLRWRGGEYAWGISGVNYDAAFRNLVRGVMLAASGAGKPDRGD